MVISMLKIRRPLGRLIFNMGIAIPGKTVFLIETAPRMLSNGPVKKKQKQKNKNKNTLLRNLYLGVDLIHNLRMAASSSTLDIKYVIAMVDHCVKGYILLCVFQQVYANYPVFRYNNL